MMHPIQHATVHIRLPWSGKSLICEVGARAVVFLKGWKVLVNETRLPLELLSVGCSGSSCGLPALSRTACHSSCLDQSGGYYLSSIVNCKRGVAYPDIPEDSLRG
jgi:hypothetical protein